MRRSSFCLWPVSGLGGCAARIGGTGRGVAGCRDEPQGTQQRPALLRQAAGHPASTVSFPIRAPFLDLADDLRKLSRGPRFSRRTDCPVSGKTAGWGGPCCHLTAALPSAPQVAPTSSKQHGVNVSVNASATPFQQPSGYGSHGYNTGKPRPAFGVRGVASLRTLQGASRRLARAHHRPPMAVRVQLRGVSQQQQRGLTLGPVSTAHDRTALRHPLAISCATGLVCGWEAGRGAPKFC